HGMHRLPISRVCLARAASLHVPHANSVPRLAVLVLLLAATALGGGCRHAALPAGNDAASATPATEAADAAAAGTAGMTGTAQAILDSKPEPAWVRAYDPLS